MVAMVLLHKVWFSMYLAQVGLIFDVSCTNACIRRDSGFKHITSCITQSPPTTISCIHLWLSIWCYRFINITIGFSFFAECQADIHSAKPLPSVTLGKGRSVNSLSAKTSLPSALYRALGKGFAECQSDTRQRKVAVTASATVKAALPSAVDLDTRERCPLCRVSPTRHSAKWRPLMSAWPVALGKSVMFAECDGHCTRQSMFPDSSQMVTFAECHGHCTRQSDW